MSTARSSAERGACQGVNKRQGGQEQENTQGVTGASNTQPGPPNSAAQSRPRCRRAKQRLPRAKGSGPLRARGSTKVWVRRRRRPPQCTAALPHATGARARRGCCCSSRLGARQHKGLDDPEHQDCEDHPGKGEAPAIVCIGCVVCWRQGCRGCQNPPGEGEGGLGLGAFGRQAACASRRLQSNTLILTAAD